MPFKVATSWIDLVWQKLQKQTRRLERKGSCDPAPAPEKSKCFLNGPVHPRAEARAARLDRVPTVWRSHRRTRGDTARPGWPFPSPPSACLLPLPLTTRRAWVSSCSSSLRKSPSWSSSPALTSVPKDAGGGLGAVRWGQRPAGSTGATELCSRASAPGPVGTVRVPSRGRGGACRGWEDEVAAFRTQSLFPGSLR